jgi:hypothetical protein
MPYSEMGGKFSGYLFATKAPHIFYLKIASINLEKSHPFLYYLVSMEQGIFNNKYELVEGSCEKANRTKNNVIMKVF